MADQEILDAINEGRFPAAKRDLALKLKRFPNKSYYWALQCYYLYATGEIEQAEKEARTLKIKVPSDPLSLELLANVFKKLGFKKDANEVWENAIKKYPTTDLILTWFTKAVNNFDARNMQKASMFLQKHAASNRDYRVWAAYANYLWSSETSVEKEQGLHVLLAAGLIEKAEPLQSNQEIFVKAQILAKKGDFSGVASLLEPVSPKILELTLLYLNALDQTEKWQILRDESSRLLFEEKFNDFDTWKYLIRSSHHLNIDKTELVAVNTLGTRNSYVANMEIAKQYDYGLEAAIETYYKKFSSKPCCPFDLANYPLSEEFYKNILDEAAQLLASDTLDDKQVATLTNIEKLQISKNSAYRVDWQNYAKYKNPGFSDLYLISMIQDLAVNWSPEKLVQHIIQLEHYSKEDPENFRVKLWLLNLYIAIDASSLSSKVYSDLAIKMIQHDLYLYKLEHIPNLRNLNDLVQIFRFYLTSDGEVSAFVGGVFEKHLYTKVEDFLLFGKRLSTSLSRHLIVLKIMRMARRLHNEYYNYFFRMLREQKDVVLSDEFTVSDNRDFTTEYDFGVRLAPLPFQNGEKSRGREYVQLHYLLELLVVEKNDREIARLLKLFNKWLSNQQYTSQLSPFENQVFKIYLSVFKLVKVKESKDSEQQLNFLAKNLDFKKFKSFISKLPPLSGELSHIIVDLHEIIGMVRALLRNTQLLDIALKLEKDIALFRASSEQLDFLKSLRSKLEFSYLLETFVDDKFDMLEDGLRNSTYIP